MNFDLNETVQHNGRPVSLLNAVREILQLPAVKRFPGSALFRDPGKQPAIFREGAACGGSAAVRGAPAYAHRGLCAVKAGAERLDRLSCARPARVSFPLRGLKPWGHAIRDPGSRRRSRRQRWPARR
jgi:hypothetical protein